MSEEMDQAVERLRNVVMCAAGFLQNYDDAKPGSNARAEALGEALWYVSEGIPNQIKDFYKPAKKACKNGEHVYTVDADPANGTEDIVCVLCGEGHHARF